MDELPNDPNDLEEWDLNDLDKWDTYVFERVVRWAGKNNFKVDKYRIKDSFSYYHKNALLMRYSYIYAEQWIAKYSYDEMLEVAFKFDKIERMRKDYSPFSLAIQMLFHGINNATRNRYGKVLEYAYLHAVPSEWLLGFIVQCGGLAQVSKKHKKKYREHWRQTSEAIKNQAKLDCFKSNTEYLDSIVEQQIKVFEKKRKEEEIEDEEEIETK